ncbi:MAG: protease complex subunit PrcB family protein [Rhodocyclales bacterium]|nr:protease complex subunit PrcB family protein [Rhodocyclales bacterium]
MNKAVVRKLLLQCFCLLSCASSAAASWPILETATQAQCGWSTRDLAVLAIGSETQWHAAFAAISPPFRHAPDWRREAVVVLALGTRPTPSYAIKLSEKHFSRHGRTLQLEFLEQVPTADTILPQVISQPCLIILTKRGNWRNIVARNAKNGILVRASLADMRERKTR